MSIQFELIKFRNPATINRTVKLIVVAVALGLKAERVVADTLPYLSWRAMRRATEDDVYIPHPAPDVEITDNTTMGGFLSMLKVGPCWLCAPLILISARPWSSQP